MLWISIVALIAAVKCDPPPTIGGILRPLAYVGILSYPLYLIHQDIGSIFFNWMGLPYSDEWYPRLLRFFLAPTLFVAIAGLIHAYAEKPLIQPLTRMLSGRWPYQRQLASPAAVQ
jgi:peptidoglycan/LPS O-acetylase OafA/YrhL